MHTSAAISRSRSLPISLAGDSDAIQSQTNNEPSKFRKYLTIKSDRARAFPRIASHRIETRNSNNETKINLENCNCRWVFGARALPKRIRSKKNESVGYMYIYTYRRKTTHISRLQARGSKYICHTNIHIYIYT